MDNYEEKMKTLNSTLKEVHLKYANTIEKMETKFNQRFHSLRQDCRRELIKDTINDLLSSNIKETDRFLSILTRQLNRKP